MKTNIKKLKNCKTMAEVKLPAERVKDEFDKVYASLQKVATIPGFRAGKVPRDLLEKHYAKTAKEEVIKKLVPETYKSLLDQYKLDPIGYPDINDLKLDLKEGFFYKVSIETRPEVAIKSYKGLKLKKKKVELKEEEVQRNLESLRDMNAQSVPKKDSDDKEKVLPKLDDEFAKDLGFENLEKMKLAIRENLRSRLEKDAESDLEMQAINQLVSGTNFEIPESLVNSEKERLIKDANSRIAYMESMQKTKDPEKKFTLSDKDKKELEESSSKQAVRQVKAFFILDKIAQMEKLQITQEEFEANIDSMAAQYKRPKEEVRKYLEKNNMLDEMVVNLRNKKVTDLLIKEAKVQ